MRLNALASCVIFLFQNVCCQSGNEADWVDPHVWSQLTLDDLNPGNGCSQCQVEQCVGSTDDALALMYFKKFIKSMFNKKRLHYDEASTLYKRSLLFTLQPSQLEELETFKDVRDLDIVLTRILENAQAAPLSAGSSGCNYVLEEGQGVLALVTDIFKDLVQLLKISEVKFLLMVLLAIAAIWLVHRRFRYRVLTCIIGGFVLFGYFHTYLECNRKLEIEQMIDVLENNQPLVDISELSWFGRIKNYWTDNSLEVQQKQKLRKSTKLNLAYCRPDHVLIMYMNELFLKQLEMLLEQVTHTLANLSSGLPWPYNWIASVILVCLIGYIVKLTFIYILSPRAWAPLLHGRPAQPQAPAAALGSGADGDRLSGENLRMLLNVVKATSSSTAAQQLPAISGVQNVLEPLEAPEPTIARAVGEKFNESESSSNSSSAADSAQAAGFTLVDDEDSVENL